VVWAALRDGSEWNFLQRIFNNLAFPALASFFQAVPVFNNFPASF